MVELSQMKKLHKNFLNSVNGLIYVFKEYSFKAELVGGFFLIPYLFFFEIALFLKLLIFSLYLILLGFELLNTSIEKLCNKITVENDNDIKIIKDLSSASVFIIFFLLVILLIISFYLS